MGLYRSTVLWQLGSLAGRANCRRQAGVRARQHDCLCVASSSNDSRSHRVLMLGEEKAELSHDFEEGRSYGEISKRGGAAEKSVTSP